MPPAATSYEDIYHQTASSSLASASPSTYHHHHHLPDYMMLLGTNEKQPSKQQDSSIDQKKQQQVLDNTNGTQSITIKQTSNRPTQQQQQQLVEDDGQQNVSLSSSVPSNSQLKSKKTLSLLNQQPAASQCCWHKLQEQETYYDTYLLPNKMFQSEPESSTSSEAIGNANGDDNGHDLSIFMKSQPTSRDTIDFLRSSVFYQVEDDENEFDEDEYDDEADDDCPADVNGPLGYPPRPLLSTFDTVSASSTPTDIHLIASADVGQNDLSGYNFQKRRHSQNPNIPALESSSSSANTTSCNQMKEQHHHQQQVQLNQHQHYLTIEELKLTLNSCWLCGCNWQEDHVSLDCQECGGYAMSRPCPNCDGKCRSIWTRNITKTHDSHKATWTGQCSRLAEPSSGCSKIDSHHNRHHNYHHHLGTSTSTSTTCCCNKKSNNISGTPTSNKTHPLASSSSCCSSQPSSATSSDCDEEEADEMGVLGKQC